MSYPIDLEEVSDDALDVEIERRQRLRRQGLCSYCGKPFNSDNPCRLHEHSPVKVNGRIIVTVRQWVPLSRLEASET